MVVIYNTIPTHHERHEGVPNGDEIAGSALFLLVPQVREKNELATRHSLVSHVTQRRGLSQLRSPVPAPPVFLLLFIVSGRQVSW